MSSYTTTINFTAIILFVVGTWAVLGFSIPYLIKKYELVDMRFKLEEDLNGYRYTYFIGTYVLSSVLAWGYIGQPEIGETVPLKILFPQLIVLWDLATWIPIEFSAVLLVAEVLLVILVRERGLTI